MTSKSSSSTPKPFLLSPVGKDYLWGGSRLNDDFSKKIPLSPLAETWECSTHPDGLSVVASGKFKGKTLKEVLSTHPEYLGGADNGKGELPILIKLIDAKRDLSVQVHPSDEYAREHENGQLGKTEMWYVMDAAKDSELTYGFKTNISRRELRSSMIDGTVEKYLQRVPVHRDDVFFIEAGTVHAIGAGALIAEIQESSNLTYRLYDYNRIDKNGKKRELHMEKALDVARLTGGDRPRQPMRVLKYRPGSASEFLCRCKYFQVERLLINTERCRTLARLEPKAASFRVLLCVGGCGTLTDNGSVSINFFIGDCIFIPADTDTLYLHGKAQLLRVTC